MVLMRNLVIIAKSIPSRCNVSMMRPADKLFSTLYTNMAFRVLQSISTIQLHSRNTLIL